MSNMIIIYFNIGTADFRLVTGRGTGRNDFEKSEPDRTGKSSWQRVGYEVDGLPTAELILQAALVRAFANKSTGPDADVTEKVDTSLCKLSHGDIEIRLLKEDIDAIWLPEKKRR